MEGADPPCGNRKGKAFTGVLSGQGTRAHALAFSRDGRMLAAGHDAAKKGMPGLMVWDMRQMTPRQGIATVRRVHALGWTPDNLTLAYAPNGKGGGVHVLDLGDSRERLRLGEGEQVMALAISPDGKTVVQGLPRWQGDDARYGHGPACADVQRP